ncbi:MAG: NAD(P)-dependent oxidoreductase, partial [Rickettsiales bacterium]|nr:NAD(P)-dependent oxidoreductase [Rickettsiales bacterium]
MSAAPDCLVIGSEGMLGRALREVLGPRAKGLSRRECDFHAIDFLDAVEAAYLAQPFTAIINAAAYTRVDDAESEDSGELLRVNAIAPGELAAWCEKRGVAFVHFSTDYVFDGHGDAPWKEDDAPAPLNAYGMSKLMGERSVAAAGGKYLIFRLSWVYDHRGRNFFMRMRELMMQREQLSVVDNQIGAPSYAPQVAQGVVQALEHARKSGDFPSGIYHLCHAGETSW